MSENDVRIYVSKKEMNKNASEFSGSFDAVMRQKANGNIDKARRLGAALATIAPTGDGDGIFVNLKDHLSPKFFVQDILYQIRVLLVFACETLLQMELPTELLSTTAIASMYDAMEKDMPGFYNNIANGAAFTFYYLAIQKGGDISENIGEAFAMLCAVKNKDSFVLAGKTVWNIAVDIIEKEIEKADITESAQAK
ncbi:MAG: hypothetical protein J6V06_04485 [Clostridia bacterium]|nr:hypothetical protein [Clostridia bacterium]MBO7319259.1 hypothetical protein [Clostridia bacterium]